MPPWSGHGLDGQAFPDPALGEEAAHAGVLRTPAGGGHATTGGTRIPEGDTTACEPGVLADLSDRLATIARHHPAAGAGGPDDTDELLAEAVTDTARALLTAADVPDVGQPVTVDDLPADEDAGIGAAPPSLAWAAALVAWACDQIIGSHIAGLHDELTELAVAHRRPTLAWRLRQAELDALAAPGGTRLATSGAARTTGIRPARPLTRAAPPPNRPLPATQDGRRP
jgi:hypothetical protein